MTQFAIDYAEDITEALDELGIDILIIETAKGAYNAVTRSKSASPVVTNHTIKAFPPYRIDHEDAEVSGLDAASLIVVAKLPLPFSVIKKDEIVMDFNGFKYTLNEVRYLYSGDTPTALELIFVKG